MLMCVHNALKRQPANNNWRLSTIVDIDVLVRTGVDWNRFVQLCIDLCIVPYVYFSLIMAKKLINTPVPQSIRTRLKGSCTPAQLFLTRLHLRCIDSLESSNMLLSNLYKILRPFIFGGTWRDRIKGALLTPLWLPTREFVASKYGLKIDSPVLILGYLVNPIRGAYLAVRKVLNRLA